MTREQALQAVRTWIIAVTELPEDRVIIAGEGRGTAPPRPHAAVSVLSWGQRAGEDDRFHFDDPEATEEDEADLLEVHTGPRAATVQVTIRSAGPGSGGAPILDPSVVLDALTDSLAHTTVRAAFDAAGMAIRAISAPRALPSARPTEWEVAASCDFSAGYIGRSVDRPGHIEQVVGDIELSDTSFTVETPNAPE